jgi:site-specific DNA-methyltransferase (adenine-specific)
MRTKEFQGRMGERTAEHEMAPVNDNAAGSVVLAGPAREVRQQQAAAATGARAQIRLICGAAAEALSTLPDESIDGVVTDPPHGVLKQSWDVLPTAELWQAVLRVLKPGVPLIAIGAPQTYHRMVGEIEKAGFITEDMAVWAFSTGRPPSERRLKRGHAPIVIARKPGPKQPLGIEEGRLPFVDDHDREQTKRADMLRRHARRRDGVYARDFVETRPFEPKAGRWPANLMLTAPELGDHDRFFLVPVVRDHEGHAAAKPVQLIAQLLRLFIPAGGTVLDPFAGGGSTGVAAVVTGRGAVLIERDPGFAAMARKATTAAQAGDLSMTVVERVNAASPRAVENTRPDEHLRTHESSQQGCTPQASAAMEPVDARGLARHLGGHVAPRTLVRWARAGRIPALRVGRKYLYDRAAVAAALAGSHTHEVHHVDSGNQSQSLRDSGVPLRSSRRDAVSSVQANRGSRRRKEAGEDIRVRGERVGRPSEGAEGRAGQGYRAGVPLDPAQGERLRRLLGANLSAVGKG